MLANIKKIIPGWLRKILSQTYWYATMPLNALWYYLFHRKFIKGPDQRGLWENRKDKDFSELQAVEQDSYYQYVAQFMSDKLAELNSDSYLEVDCFFGYRLNKFAKRLADKRFFGLDLGLNNLRLAQEKVIEAKNVFLVNGNACALPVKDYGVETIYTVTCLTHLDYSLINRAIDEMIRVSAKNVVLLEVDMRPMTFKNRLRYLNWNYGFMHPYEKIMNNRLDLVCVTPLYDESGHPRYTVFHFQKDIMNNDFKDELHIKNHLDMEFAKCDYCGAANNSLIKYKRQDSYIFDGKNLYGVYQCRNCHLFFTYPRFSNERREKYFLSRYHKERFPDSKKVIKESIRANYVILVKNLIRKYVTKSFRKDSLFIEGVIDNHIKRIDGKATVLEIGCGTMPLLYLKSMGYKYLGIEPSEQVVSIFNECGYSNIRVGKEEKLDNILTDSVEDL